MINFDVLVKNLKSLKKFRPFDENRIKELELILTGSKTIKDIDLSIISWEDLDMVERYQLFDEEQYYYINNIIRKLCSIQRMFVEVDW